MAAPSLGSPPLVLSTFRICPVNAVEALIQQIRKALKRGGYSTATRLP